MSTTSQEAVYALTDELEEVGIRPTSLESKFGTLLVMALETWVPPDRSLADLLFEDWKPEEGDFARFAQERLALAYRDEPGQAIRCLADAMLIQAAINCQEPERVIALFAEEAQHRVWHQDDEDEDDDPDDPAEPLRWADEWRRLFATKGWIPSELPDPRGWQERDITMDRCRACGKLRREGLVIDRRFDPEGEERLDDPCIRDLPGVGNCCCGHGRSGRSVYVAGLSGPAAAERMRELGGNPPPAAFLAVEDEESAEA